MDAELDDLVDDVAMHFGRAALVLDSAGAVRSYSTQGGANDAMRVQTILTRHALPDMADQVRSVGAAEGNRLMRLDGDDETGRLARWWVPLRHRGLLLGSLWLIDSDAPLSYEHRRQLVIAAEGIAQVLYPVGLHGVSALMDRDVDALLAGGPEVEETARRLAAENHLSDVPRVAVVVRADGPVSGVEEMSRLLTHVVLAAPRLRTVGMLQLTRADHGVVVIPAPESLGEVECWLDRALATVRRLPTQGRIVLGVGDPRTDLAAISASYVEAQHAARTALCSPAGRSVAWWSRIGVDRAVMTLTQHLPPDDSVHAGLARAVRDTVDTPLLETLETFLDLAGNVAATAEELNLHRTTLYHRLRRVEKMLDTDLADGEERLALHLGLRLARARGSWRGHR